MTLSSWARIPRGLDSPPSDIIPLSRFRSLSLRSSAKKRLDAILSVKETEKEVRSLSVQELFTLIQEVGFADSQELLELAAPEQIRGCLDLDCWERDRISMEATVPWLAALLECGFEKVGDVWPTLDAEFAALIIANGAEVYDKSLGEGIDDNEERPFFDTPDTFFSIVLTSEREDEQLVVRRIIEDLYRADGQEARHVLISARSEMRSYLEEMSYRWRSGRLADLGYVEFYEALEVFRPLAPDAVTLDEGTGDPHPSPAEGDEVRTTGHLPTPVLEQVVGRPFLAKVLGSISNAETGDRLEAALLYLVNRVLSAARVSPGDAEAMSVGTTHASATLALGLEYLSEGDPKVARQFLEKVSLTRIHRVGYTLTLRIARTARAIAPRSLSAGDPAPMVLSALLGARPFYACALDFEGSEDLRPFESRVDLAKTAVYLQDLALRLAIAEALGANLSPDNHRAEGPSLDDFGKTALLRQVTGGELSAEAFKSDELLKLRGTDFSDESSQVAAGRSFQAMLQGHGVAGTPRLGPLLERWAAELKTLLTDLPDEIDPRFIEGVLISA